uniref:Uncharacterized protein n=1 Tax=Marmota marmota marmota TaxID=9994 RepID=A0A8C5YNR6_MARMA
MYQPLLDLSTSEKRGIMIIITDLLGILHLVSRNPMQTEGCSHLLKSVRDNPASALELLDFSDMQVNREFDDLASSVKVEILPGFCIKTNTLVWTQGERCPCSSSICSCFGDLGRQNIRSQSDTAAIKISWLL